MASKVTARDKILEAATVLFHLKGYHATALSEILKESGAPKGSLYYYFPNGKEQLAIEAIHLSAKTISTAIKENLAAYDDPVKAFQYHIGNIAKQFKDLQQKTHFRSVPLGLLAMETVFVNENLRQACEDTFTMWENLYYDKLIMSGFNEERAYLISKAISALIEGGVTLCFTKKSSDPLHDANKLIPLLLSQ